MQGMALATTKSSAGAALELNLNMRRTGDENTQAKKSVLSSHSLKVHNHGITTPSLQRFLGFIDLQNST